jgi:hypothetical protein
MPNGHEQVGMAKDDSAQIIKAIQTMLSNVGQQTGGAGGGSPLPGGSGAVSPQPTITFNPSGAGTSLEHAPAPQRPSVPRTGSESIGDFRSQTQATNAGLVSLGNSLSGMFGAVEQKEHAKKSALAENYLMQINGLLASGDPSDKQKAMMILEDPKIRKILKTGLEYVPLEEEVPAEAHGVQSAIQKIGRQGGGQQQPQTQRQPMIPQASQEQQLKAAMTSALLQKIKQDPASAIKMMGSSSLSSSEQHAEEFYKAGLGLSPADIQTMTAQEKLQGMKIYEQAIGAAIRGEIDMYKAQVGYKGKVEVATILSNARRYAADKVKEAWGARDKSKKGGGGTANYAAGAKIYEDYAKKYLDIIKGGKGPDGNPLSEDQIKVYQQKADSYQRQADEYLNQVGDQELMEMFMQSIDEEPDAASSDKPN